MSSLGGSQRDGGNSIDPGVPGAGNVNRWAIYPAVQNVDFEGNKIVNADIDLCGETIQDITMIDSILTGTTTLSPTHTFPGRGVFVAGSVPSVVAQNPNPGVGQESRISAILGSLDGGSLYDTRWDLASTFDGDFEVRHVTDSPTSNYTAIRVGNTLNDNLNINTSKLILSQDLSVNRHVVLGDTLTVNGDVVFAGGDADFTIQHGDNNLGSLNNKQITFGFNGTSNYPHFITSNHNASPSSGNDIRFWTSDGTEGGVYPTNAVLGLTIEDGGIATGGVTAGNITSAGGITSVGDITTESSLRGDGVDAEHVETNTMGYDTITGNVTSSNYMNVSQITGTYGIPGEPDALTISGNVRQFLARGANSDGFTGQWGLIKQSGMKIFSNLGTLYSVNCLELTSANELSIGTPRERIQLFCGAADYTNTDSYGVYCKNPSGNYVGFAHSEINGVKKYSFTAHHQSQYTGDITDENIGMVVESTGKVVGLQSKDKVYMGISKTNPEYSNATPQVRLTTTRGSKKVLGVIADVKDGPDTTTGSLVVAYDQSGYEVGDKRVMVNAIGEGLVWVANTNGVVMNGDLLQSSSIPGYAEKQEDDILRSCTIGKATMDCDFIQEKVSEKMVLKDDDGENVLDSQGRMSWVASGEKEDRYTMRYVDSRKACLLSCVYYCG